MPQSPIRVLFVCHGNICRSTMAEFVLKDMVARRGLAEQFRIESAANEHRGDWQPGASGARRRCCASMVSAGFEGKRARPAAPRRLRRLRLHIAWTRPIFAT